jgi:hypothetical protein
MPSGVLSVPKMALGKLRPSPSLDDLTQDVAVRHFVGWLPSDICCLLCVVSCLFILSMPSLVC